MTSPPHILQGKALHAKFEFHLLQKIQQAASPQYSLILISYCTKEKRRSQLATSSRVSYPFCGLSTPFWVFDLVADAKEPSAWPIPRFSAEHKDASYYARVFFFEEQLLLRPLFGCLDVCRPAAILKWFHITLHVASVILGRDRSTCDVLGNLTVKSSSCTD